MQIKWNTHFLENLAHDADHALVFVFHVVPKAPIMIDPEDLS